MALTIRRFIAVAPRSRHRLLPREHVGRRQVSPFEATLPNRTEALGHADAERSRRGEVVGVKILERGERTSRSQHLPNTVQNLRGSDWGETGEGEPRYDVIDRQQASRIRDLSDTHHRIEHEIPPGEPLPQDLDEGPLAFDAQELSVAR